MARRGPTFANGVYWFYAVKVLLLRARFTSSTKSCPFAEVQMYRHVFVLVTWRSSSRLGSPSRQLEVIRFRRQGETVIAVQVRLAVLGRDLHVEIMYDIGEEQEQ